MHARYTEALQLSRAAIEAQHASAIRAAAATPIHHWRRALAGSGVTVLIIGRPGGRSVDSARLPSSRQCRRPERGGDRVG
jgi:hypothetical protein